MKLRSSAVARRSRSNCARPSQARTLSALSEHPVAVSHPLCKPACCLSCGASGHRPTHGMRSCSPQIRSHSIGWRLNSFRSSSLISGRRIVWVWRSGVALTLSPGRVDPILEDVGHASGALPFLEDALLELWNRRRGRVLALEAYRASGGVEGALAQRADETYRRLNPEQQAIARRIL